MMSPQSSTRWVPSLIFNHPPHMMFFIRILLLSFLKCTNCFFSYGQYWPKTRLQLFLKFQVVWCIRISTFDCQHGDVSDETPFLSFMIALIVFMIAVLSSLLHLPHCWLCLFLVTRYLHCTWSLLSLSTLSSLWFARSWICWWRLCFCNVRMMDLCSRGYAPSG